MYSAQVKNESGRIAAIRRRVMFKAAAAAATADDDDDDAVIPWSRPGACRRQVS